VVSIPGKVVHRKDPIDPKTRKEDDLAHSTLPDPYGDAIRAVTERLNRLEEKIK
jgi:hypothetical protein